MEARKEACENRSRKEHYEFKREEYMPNDMEESSCQKDLMYNGDNEEAGVKKKYDYQPEINTNDNELPFKYRHLRSSLRDVRPEVYRVIAKMKNKDTRQLHLLLQSITQQHAHQVLVDDCQIQQMISLECPNSCQLFS